MTDPTNVQKPDHEPIRLNKPLEALPTLASAAPSQGVAPSSDVIVIPQQTVYYVLVAVVFFTAGFLMAWITFSARADDVKTAASNAASIAVRTAIADAVGAQGQAQVPPTAVPRQNVRLTDSMPSWGPSNAKVTIVEFSDFECPFCERYYTRTYKKLKENYGSRVRFVFRHFPLTQIHPNAMLAHIASECAKDQGKFWEYHDKLYENIQALQRDSLIQYGGQVGIANMDQFTKCVDNREHLRRVQEDMAAGEGYFVQGTPTFLINGNYHGGYMDYETFTALIERELLAPGTGR